MSIFETMTLSIALGTDAFSVAVACGCGAQELNRKNVIRASSVIALFHIFMPLIGFYGAGFLEKLLLNLFNLQGKVDNILALIGSGLLMLLGFYMIIERWLEKEEDPCNFHLEGWGLLLLAVSVSIDSLSVGIGLGMLGNINPMITLIIGPVAGLMMAAGLRCGSRIGCYVGDKAQFLGGFVLILLGLHFSGLI
ncbi:MAG: manganese efflux pump [Halanaerobiaceae bacterium]|nr:manganese efflux pump [Halanaerobiaceae bacterium]